MTKRKGLSQVWLDAMNKTDLVKPPKKSPLIIWLDDLRDPKEYGFPEAIWVKDGRSLFMLHISLCSSDRVDEVEEIHFDNDLGENSPEGYYCFTKLEEILHKGGYKGLKRVYVHSSNPSAVGKFMLAKDSLRDLFGIEMIRNQY